MFRWMGERSSCGRVIAISGAQTRCTVFVVVLFIDHGTGGCADVHGRQRNDGAFDAIAKNGLEVRIRTVPLQSERVRRDGRDDAGRGGSVGHW